MNHWGIRTKRTSEWQRQQVPSSTCSVASTVWQESHQLTCAS